MIYRVRRIIACRVFAAQLDVPARPFRFLGKDSITPFYLAEDVVVEWSNEAEYDAYSKLVGHYRGAGGARLVEREAWIAMSALDRVNELARLFERLRVDDSGDFYAQLLGPKMSDKVRNHVGDAI